MRVGTCSSSRGNVSDAEASAFVFAFMEAELSLLLLHMVSWSRKGNQSRHQGLMVRTEGVGASLPVDGATSSQVGPMPEGIEFNDPGR